MFRSSSSFDRLLERATSNLLLEPDWNAILQICDSIRSGDTNAKYAINAIKKKFYHENPHVVLYGLTVSLFVSLRVFVVEYRIILFINDAIYTTAHIIYEISICIESLLKDVYCRLSLRHSFWVN